MKTTDLTIVVPVYNEALAVESVVSEVSRELAGSDFTWEILFVDDGSTDDSAVILEKLGQKVIRHDVNKGYGAALKTGIRAAESPYVAIIDADGTYPPAEIKTLMAIRDKAPQIVGERDVTKAPWLPRIAKTFMIYFASMLFNQPMKDINSGLRIFEKATLDRYLEGCGDKFSFTSGITIGYLMDDIAIHYEPIEYRCRIGETKVKIFRFLKTFFESLIRMRSHVLAMQENEGRRMVNRGSLEDRIPPVYLGVFAFLLGMAMACLLMWPRLMDYQIVNGDVFQHTWWTASFHDPEIYQDDIYLEYAASISTPGMRAIYWIGGLFANPYIIGNILSVLLYGVCSLTLFLAVRETMSAEAGLLAAALFLSQGQHLVPLLGGLHRAFAFPTILWLLFAISARQYRTIPYILAVQALIYPIAVLISFGILAGCALFRVIALPGFMDRWAAVGAAVFVACFFMTYLVKQASTPDYFGEKITGEEMMKNPWFGVDGRHNYIPFQDYKYLIWNKSFWKSDSLIRSLFLFPLTLIAAWLRGARVGRLTAMMAAVLVSSIVLFELSKALFFKLYIPWRYMEYTMPVLVFMVAAIGLALPVYLVKPRFLSLLYIIGISIAWTMNFWDKRYPMKQSYQDELYEFVQTLPKDAMIAGDSRMSDYIGGLGYRRAYLKFELAHCWYPDYQEIIAERAKKFYSAYFSNDFEDVQEFMETEDIDYIAVNRRTLDPHSDQFPKLYFAPLEKEFRILATDNLERGYAIADRNNPELNERIVYEDHEVYLFARDIQAAK